MTYYSQGKILSSLSIVSRVPECNCVNNQITGFTTQTSQLLWHVYVGQQPPRELGMAKESNSTHTRLSLEYD